jgi:hypothetical protein
MGYATAAASLEKYLWKKVEVDMISEMYERQRVELDRVRSVRQNYQTEYIHIQKEEMDRLAARIVKYQQDRHEWTKEEQDKLDMKRRIALMTKISSNQQERCQIEMNRLRCENEKVRDKYNSSQTEVVRITQKLEQEEQDKEKLKVKFQESSQASQKELDRLVEEREKLAREIQTTKTENEVLRKELESSQQGAKEEVIKLQNIIVSLQNELGRLNVEWEKKLTAYIMSQKDEQQLDNCEAELKKVLTERDQVIVQLDKSQEMLVEAEARVAREIQKASAERKKAFENALSAVEKAQMVKMQQLEIN